MIFGTQLFLHNLCLSKWIVAGKGRAERWHELIRTAWLQGNTSGMKQLCRVEARRVSCTSKRWPYIVGSKEARLASLALASVRRTNARQKRADGAVVRDKLGCVRKRPPAHTMRTDEAETLARVNCCGAARRTTMLKMALVLGGMLALAAPAQAQMNSADLKWGPAPPVFPAGARMAVLSGDPSPLWGCTAIFKVLPDAHYQRSTPSTL
jgi:hypothetical protein